MKQSKITAQNLAKALKLLDWFVNAPALHVREMQATRDLPVEINGDNPFVQAAALLKEAAADGSN
ncbi:MAG: hypothetical protein KAT00_00200 [Planctomycetes bacterium]|nr:hypothetical protein [Planctomycetota bacterium]